MEEQVTVGRLVGWFVSQTVLPGALASSVGARHDVTKMDNETFNDILVEAAVFLVEAATIFIQTVGANLLGGKQQNPLKFTASTKHVRTRVLSNGANKA